MAKKETLTVQLMKSQARVAELEAQLAKCMEHGRALRQELNAAQNRSTTTSHETPAYKAAAETRKRVARRYFAAHPGAKSVTDEQLAEFISEAADALPEGR